MKDEILKLVTKGDYQLKEAKSNFWVKKIDEQGTATCSCCKAIKNYLKAYEIFLFPEMPALTNFRVLFRTIIEKDPDFKQFNEKIFEVKCFAEESKNKGEEFFLYPEEMNEAINIALGIREYIAKKIHFEQQFLAEYLGTSFMAI
jgi:hypothetical protein